jgi:hypothetical protein
MRWTEAEYDQYIRRGQPGRPTTISEDVFQRAVMRIAVQAGWLAYHTYRSTKSLGGFPDLILAPGPTCEAEPRVLYGVELKTDTGIVSAAQQAWLEALAGCSGVVAEVWRPAQLEEICQRLRT